MTIDTDDTFAQTLAGAGAVAFDEALDRRVAVKVHRGLGPQLQATLQREAQAMARAEQRLGPEAPRVGGLLANIGSAYRELGEYDRAAGYDQRALQIAEAAYGPDHPNVATALGNLAAVQRDRGELPAAEETVRRAIEILATPTRPKRAYARPSTSTAGPSDPSTPTWLCQCATSAPS